MRTVLISGAGVAGSALAYWLHRRGLVPTVVERAPGLRPGGQAVDVRGAALDTVERMGLLDRVLAHRSQVRGMSILDGDGNELQRSTDVAFSSGRLDSDDIELLREDLLRMLHERAAGAEFVFGDSVAAIEQRDDGVRVTFEVGPPRTFDIVVGADGLHSTVRRLMFGREAQCIRHLGMHAAIFSADNFLGLDRWQLWVRDGHAGYGVYPVRDNTELRITFGFDAGPAPHGHHDVERHKQFVAERMAAQRWETPRLLKAMWAAPDFYFDAMAQVCLERWSHGRTVLVGDAGYCSSPMSGQGTSVALVGAYVLAGALGRSDGDHDTAFAAYERRMRQFVDVNQALATESLGEAAAESSIDRAKYAIALDG